MAGYSRSYSRVNGDIIDAPDFTNEFEALELAFNKDNGHVHDGSLNNGAYIPVISDSSNLNEVVVDPVNNKVVVSTNVSNVKVPQIEIIDGALLPVINNDINIGSTARKVKNIYSAGVADLSTMRLNTGVDVSSIKDEDDMISNSDTSIATQQSIKAYVDTSIVNHTHELSKINSPDGKNVVEIDDIANRVIMSVDVGGNKVNKLALDELTLKPSANLGLALGDSLNYYSEAFVDALSLEPGFSVNSIKDENDMVSNDPNALATQRSIKAYVDANNGLFVQAQRIRSAFDSVLTTSLTTYVQRQITVSDGSAVQIFAHINAKADTTAGTITGRIYRDSTPVGTEDFIVLEATSVPHSGNVCVIEIDPGLTAGTYTYSIQLKATGTDGTAQQAFLLLLEQD